MPHPDDYLETLTRPLTEGERERLARLKADRKRETVEQAYEARKAAKLKAATGQVAAGEPTEPARPLTDESTVSSPIRAPLFPPSDDEPKATPEPEQETPSVVEPCPEPDQDPILEPEPEEDPAEESDPLSDTIDQLERCIDALRAVQALPPSGRQLFFHLVSMLQN